MTEVLLVRHAQARVNKGDLAFGNKLSPLTEKGIGQAKELGLEFEEGYGIIPSEYDLPVLASDYTRPQQTAEVAGFRIIHTNSLIDESDVEQEIRAGIDVKAKHVTERWSPDEVRERAVRFIELVRSGDLTYQIYFTHGMFTAAVLLELDQPQGKLAHLFDNKRGFIPLQAAITKVTL